MSGAQIEFSEMAIRMPAGGGVVLLVRCDQCMAILRPEDAQGHASWHGELLISIETAALKTL